MRDAPSASNNLFRRPADTEHLKCSWIFDGKHPSYVDHLKENRSTFTDDKLDLPMDCESIRSRHRFATDPTSVEERDFPIAISRQVYRDYYYHELVLAALYQPQNFYCFTIDGKAGSLFRRRFESLAKCFPNVVISNNTRPLFSSGYNLDLANIDCLKALRGGSRQWKYVMVLQNHDFPTKTNREMVQIFKWLNGTNDISITKGFEHRVDWNLTWTVNRIPVFKNDSKYHQKFAQNDLKISFAKGDNEMAVSREAIDFIFNEMNVESFVHKINRPGVFGVDELVFPTILSMPELNVPGHYTQECVEYRKMNPYITRRSNFGEKSRCNSKKFRHRICIYGVEDLRDHVHNTPYININKLMPSFDFNPIVCELESLYNRTYIQPFDEKSLDKQFYEELPHVRYHNTGRCRA
uniref:Glycosyltransferase family 92 protein n=2 Tax=Bursaphelenchus xylophilus TaxID=6326 RepID=A0A1I7RQB4_BURXY